MNVSNDEVTLLITALTGGLLVGVIGRWLDLLIAYVQGRG